MTTYLQTIMCWMIALCFSITSLAQTSITFEVLDARSGKPVSNAFLFVQNSTIGTTTNDQGLAELEIKGLEEFEVVVTHINYVNVYVASQDIQSANHQISLEPNPVDLNEVVVRSKLRNARKRKRWMRRFQSEIFGKNIKRNQLKLINPKAVWFEEQEGTLQAHAIDNLRVENKFMGYQLQFVLDHFSVTDQGDVKYTGKLFFKDIRDQMKNRKRLNKRRAQFYLESRQLFFLSLLHRLPLNGQEFEFGITTDHGNKNFSYQKMSYDSLRWRHGLHSDTLLIDDYLTITNKNLSPRRDKVPTSFLRSATGQFILNRNGKILNPLDIEESGYWSGHRLAVELPIDYDGGIPMNSPYQIIDSLTAYAYRTPPEKVYLHTNKTFFSNREQLWFKGYLVNGISHRPVTESQVLYVDLINPGKEVIQTWELHTEHGLAGDFQFTRKNEPGTYHLRAYTNFMRNKEDVFFFEQPITVIDFLNSEAQPAPGKEVEQSQAEPVVTFFPEGGDLIAGLTANVAFQVQDQNGLPIETTGYISNDRKEKLLSFKTYHQGTGLFSFIPEREQVYFFNFTLQERHFSFQLPEVFPRGMTLHVNATEEDELFIEVEATDSLLLQNAFLVGHSRGALFLRNGQLQHGQSFKVSKGQTPAGLLHFTLFDGQQRPQAERLVFNDFGVTESPIVITEMTEGGNSDLTTKLKIECDSSIISEHKDASACIVNLDLVPDAGLTDDIRSYMLLNSDLHASIPNAGYYLEEIDDVKRFYLDLLLLCQTWRRFTWRSLFDGTDQRPTFQPETGYAITGYTTQKDDSARVQSEIMLNSLDETIFYKKIRTDEAGNFSFSQLPASDSTDYLLQARINKEKEESREGTISGNRLVKINLSPRSRAPFTQAQAKMFQTADLPQISTHQRGLYREKSQTDEQYSAANWTIDLESVEVTAKRSYTSNRPGKGKFYDLDGMDWIPPQAKGTGLLARLAPRFNFRSGAEGKLVTTFFNNRGELVTVPVQVIINGMGADPTGSNALRFLSLPADAIKTIAIGRTAIVVTTRKIPRSKQAYLESGILQYSHPGYYRAREFKLPEYPVHANYDLRSTVLWEPNVAFDEHGTAVLEFAAANFPARYQIRVMGLSASGEILQQTYTIQR